MQRFTLVNTIMKGMLFNVVHFQAHKKKYNKGV